MPSCLFLSFLKGKANPKIHDVKQCLAWHRTKVWPAQLPAEALTRIPPKNPQKCSFQHPGLFGRSDTLWKLGPAGQEVHRSDQTWRNKGIAEPLLKLGLESGKWETKRALQRQKLEGRGCIGIACSLTAWEWWNIRWAMRKQVPFGTTHANN